MCVELVIKFKLLNVKIGPFITEGVGAGVGGEKRTAVGGWLGGGVRG